MFKNKKVAIMAQDYGGADYLSHYIINKKINKKFNCYYYLKGPAIEVFKKRKIIGNYYKYNSSWSSNIQKLFYCLNFEKKIERFVILKAIKNKIFTSLCIDGWGNYKKKMIYDKNNKIFFPNEINVFNKKAYDICMYLGLKNKSKIIINKHIAFNKDYLKFKKKIKKNKKIYLLYLSSPLEKLDKKKIEILQTFAQRKGLKLKIRLHPKEREQVYKIKKEKNLYINTTNLIQKDLISSKYVIGHCSTALVYSRLLGIKTLSIQPKLYKDLFDWDKFYIFKNYKITNLNSFKSLNKF